MEEIGRAGWLMLGVTGMAAAGVAHAIADAARIAADVVRAPKPGEPRVSGTRAEGGPSRAGGWVLFALVLLAAGAARHLLVAARDLGREILARPRSASNESVPPRARRDVARSALGSGRG